MCTCGILGVGPCPHGVYRLVGKTALTKCAKRYVITSGPNCHTGFQQGKVLKSKGADTTYNERVRGGLREEASFGQRTSLAPGVGGWEQWDGRHRESSLVKTQSFCHLLTRGSLFLWT